jgi:hypothetical protein
MLVSWQLRSKMGGEGRRVKGREGTKRSWIVGRSSPGSRCWFRRSCFRLVMVPLARSWLCGRRNGRPLEGRRWPEEGQDPRARRPKRKGRGVFLHLRGERGDYVGRPRRAATAGAGRGCLLNGNGGCNAARGKRKTGHPGQCDAVTDGARLIKDEGVIGEGGVGSL